MDTRYFNLVGEYEEALEIPEESCTMNYWKKLDTHFIISEKYLDEVRKLEDEALKVIGQTRESFESDERFASRKFIETEILKGLKTRFVNQMDIGMRYIDLVASYEEVLEVPGDERTTEYFGDLSLHYIKPGDAMEKAREIKHKALGIIRMTQEEFDAREEFSHRSIIKGAVIYSLQKFKCISECADKNYIFRNLSVPEIHTVENILQAYKDGKIDLDIPRDVDSSEIDFDGEFNLIINEPSYEEVGIEVTVLKWYESHEDTGYMVEVVQSKNSLQDEIEQTADEMGGMCME